MNASFDTLIRGGTLIDGTGAKRFRADVAIRGDRIAAVGDLARAEADRVLDATGRIVAPGFIDVHNHSDGWLLKRPHLEAKTTQGFTTEVLAADGIGYAPVDEHTWREWLFYLRGLDGLRVDEYRGWRTLADFMRRLDRANAENAATHIPYANIRSLVCGFGRVAVDDFHARQIRLEIRRGMEAGAVGLSTGIDYIVQCFSTTDELVDACRIVAEYGGLYVTHMRYKRGLLPALAEAVEIGRRSGVKVHISHLKGPTAAEGERALEYIDRTARHEVDFSFDVYPYQPGSTMLSYLLPYEAWVGGPLAALARLNDPLILARFREGLGAQRLNLDKLRIAWVAGRENAQHIGKTLDRYVADTGLAAHEALANLLIEERLAVLLVFDEGDDALARPFLQHDLGMIGTDGIFFDDGRVHPRMYGTTGRILGSCVRDLRLFSLEEAVHKLSGRPAERFGLAERGGVREGAVADLVVFDPERAIDHATYENPHQFTTGIEHVLVSGVPVVEAGRPLAFEPGDSLPGRFIASRR
ncbi:MAG: D-aminoacylase [Planctomycetes bacterium]|nr:D-aminoacylase [Planctomycetota bacterium]